MRPKLIMPGLDKGQASGGDIRHGDSSELWSQWLEVALRFTLCVSHAVPQPSDRVFNVPNGNIPWKCAQWPLLSPSIEP